MTDLLTNKQLTNQDFARYARHLTLPEFGEAGQKRLKSASVLIIGAGGLGCPVMLYLAAAGVGRIAIIDNDKVEESNLQRQVLYDASDLGKEKCLVAVEKLRKLNPLIEIDAICDRICVLNATKLVSSFDLIVDGSDNFATRFLVNDACVVLNKPFVSASIFKFTGQLSLFNGVIQNGDRSGSYRCLFPEPPPAELVPSCGELGVLGVVPGILGTLQACEAVKYLARVGETLLNRLMVVDLLSMQFRTVQFSRNQSIINNTKLLNEDAYLNLGMCAMTSVKELTALQLKSWIDNGQEFCLIDVREDFEKKIADIGGELIPLKTFSSNISRLPQNKTIVVYCRSGGRSMSACQELLQKGFNNIYNLSGGILAWSDEVDSSVQKY